MRFNMLELSREGGTRTRLYQLCSKCHRSEISDGETWWYVMTGKHQASRSILLVAGSSVAGESPWK